MEGGAAKHHEGKEPKGGAKNPIHQMMIFEEMVHKEVAFQRTQQGREYTINPFTMAVISEKPNHVTPKEPFRTKPVGQPADKVGVPPSSDDVVDRAFRLEAMKRKIQTAALQPRQKYPTTQTSNQEVGWFINPLVPSTQKSKELWTFNRKKTPITGYAEEYVTLTKVNPFAVKDR